MMLPFGVAGVVFMIYMGVVYFVADLFGLPNRWVWVVRIGLMLIGALVTGLVLYMLRRKKKRREAAAREAEAGADADELKLILRDAQQQLGRSQTGKKKKLGDHPVFFVLGDPGSTKTSAVEHCGLEPDLLAGQVYHDHAIIPTRALNLWFARDAVFIEAGGALAGDREQMRKLFAQLRHGRMQGVLGSGEEAPRAAVLCVDAETFVKPGASEALSALARKWNALLGEASEQLGARLPVYVLFTRCDRVTYFMDFVRNLTSEEAHQVCGITLPMNTDESGVYAERETRRLTNAFQELVYTVGDRRLDYLARESEREHSPNIYEFPREFRKLRTMLVQFLVDLGRPSQLRANPFLRGFYFSGVRPVFVEDAVAPSAAAPESFAGASDATRMFRAGLMGQQQAQPERPRSVGTRKVPQWLFLGRLFSDVLLVDRAALGASGVNTKASLVQRALLATAACLALVWIIGLTVSFFNNRALREEAIAAARSISQLEPAQASLASLDSLQRLDSLRVTAEKLFTYRQEGAPWSLRWGIYSGNRLYPGVRKLYFNSFHKLMFGETQNGLLARLRGLPKTPGPNDDYGLAYDTLKAYLITTSHHDKATLDFLPPALLRQYLAGRETDDEKLALMERQFQFYSRELAIENPYSSDNDGGTVQSARAYLLLFEGIKQIYQSLLSAAGRDNPPINFNRAFPGSERVLVSRKEVPGAFSYGGYQYVMDAIAKGSYLEGEDWVLGRPPIAPENRAQLGEQLRDLYMKDFATHWREYVKTASVVRYRDIGDAATKLIDLSSNQSALLELLWLASKHTNQQDVNQLFQPVHAVVPPPPPEARPADIPTFVSDPNTEYIAALASIQSSLERLSAKPLDRNDPVVNRTLDEAAQAKLTARRMSQKFNIDRVGQVDQGVLNLLLAPITYVEGVLGAIGKDEINAAAGGVCKQLAALYRKYPFDSKATQEANLDEIGAVFRPGTGSLWSTYTEKLQDVLPFDGVQYTPKASGDLRPSPQFVSYFNRAATFSKTLYPENSREPRLAYTLGIRESEGIGKLKIEMDGQILEHPGGEQSKQFIWPAAAGSARLSGNLGGASDLDFFGYSGLWAAFRLFGDAEQWVKAGDAWDLEWFIKAGGRVITSGGRPVTIKLRLSMQGDPQIFRRDYLGRLGCVATAIP